MSCYHPVTVNVWRRSVVKDSLRIGQRQEVPCGSCIGCRADQARDWSVRILHEVQVNDSAWFVTLTYDEKNLPGNGSLRPSDVRKFVRTVRRSGEKVRYFICGEYGSRTLRPHYHAVLFGPDFLDRVVSRHADGHTFWRSPTLEKWWRGGHSDFSAVTFNSAAYVAGYVQKKVLAKVNAEQYTRVDPVSGELVEVHPEFARMSLKPALGRRWLEKYWTDVYPRDRVVVEGRELPVPRYYDKWLEVHHPEVMFAVKERRYEELQEIPEAKLAARERIHASRLSFFSRRNAV